MIKQLTLFCTFAIFMAAFLGFSVSAFAGKECVQGDTRPKCTPGGGGDDHGDPPAQYCAELISGGFDFGTVNGKVTVTRNNRGNEYNSPDGLHMYRSDTYSPEAWDAVFATCDVLSSREGEITELTVSDKWAIGNSGGKSAGEPYSPVTVSFKNAYNAEFYPDIEVDLHLRGELPAGGFPLERGQSEDPPYVDIPLYDFWFYVHAAGTDSCKIITTFEKEGDVPHSVLRMTWGAC